jgi:hypothetical protein
MSHNEISHKEVDGACSMQGMDEKCIQVSVRKPEKPGCRCEDNSEMDLKEI